MRRIELHEPEVGERAVRFSWTVDPSSDLYAQEEFDLRFDDRLDPRTIPIDLWWTVALICLHNHWALLRPCRIELPVTLARGEREFWLRRIDATVETLELGGGGGDIARSVEIDDRGPVLQPTPAPGGKRPALGFSAGKDSLLTLGLLRELGERPLAVTTTSPMWPLVDHASPRRRTALETISALPDVDHVEVRSSYRQCWDNTFARTRGYDVAVSELSDTMLYAAATVAVGWAHGASHVLLASEAQVQETTVIDGVLVQHPHHMYSAITQRSIGRLLGRRGLDYSSLTYPLNAWQVTELLWGRYPELRELQYSCWRHERGHGACSACTDCLTIALSALEAGVAPKRAGIDTRRLMIEMGDWEPRLEGGELPDPRVRRQIHAATVRQLQRVRTRAFAIRLARTDPRQLLQSGSTHTLKRYAYLRARTGQQTPVPDPGYNHSYLSLVDERWADRLEAIFDSCFARAPVGDDSPALERATAAIDWISAPLQES